MTIPKSDVGRWLWSQFSIHGRHSLMCCCLRNRAQVLILWPKLRCTSKFSKSTVYSHRGLQSSRCLQWCHKVKIVSKVVQTSFLFVILIYSWVYSGVFQRLHDMQYYNRVNAKADRRIQLFSVKPDIRDKNIKWYNSSHYFLCENTAILLKTYCLCWQAMNY